MQQKMLDLARALATNPQSAVRRRARRRAQSRPSSTASPTRLRELARGGMALLVVEHLMGFIDHVTDRVIVLNAGKEIFEGALAAAIEDRQVIEVFLGGEHAG